MLATPAALAPAGLPGLSAAADKVRGALTGSRHGLRARQDSPSRAGSTMTMHRWRARPHQRMAVSRQASEASNRGLLETVYTVYDSLKWSPSATIIPEADQKRMMDLSQMQGPKAWTYGEISYEGVGRLQEELKLTSSDVFYDLGSGLGRMTLQVHLEWPVRKSVGVELSKDRHDRAANALKRMGSKAELEAKEVQFRNENLLDTDMGDATVVYLACTCWDADFMEEVLTLLEQLSDLKWVVSTEDLRQEFGIQDLRGLVLDRTLDVSMSWDDSWPIYVYAMAG